MESSEDPATGDSRHTGNRGESGVKRRDWLKKKFKKPETLRQRRKGEKERYIHLNAEFQRIARRDEKAFLSDHCKETEENRRMGKSRDLFKKIKSYQENISYKDGHYKGQKWYGPNRSRRY